MPGTSDLFQTADGPQQPGEILLAEPKVLEAMPLLPWQIALRLFVGAVRLWLKEQQSTCPEALGEAHKEAQEAEVLVVDVDPFGDGEPECARVPRADRSESCLYAPLEDPLEAELTLR